MEPTWEMPPPAVLPDALTPYVATMFGYRGSGLRPGVHRGLPSHTLTMVCSIGGPLRTAAATEDLAAGRIDSQWLTLGGLHTRAAMVVQPERWCGVQLSLHPLGVRRLLGVPTAALPTDGWDAREVLGPDVDRVTQELDEVRGWPARYAAVADFLQRRLAAVDDRRGTSREVAEAWRRLGATGGTARVGDVAAQVGYSRRRLTQLFTAEVGHGPKTVARMMRFDATRRELAARVRRGDELDPGLDLAGLAARRGYADHAHLVREFRELAGLSPTGWIAEEFPNIQAGAHPAAAS